MAVMELWQQRLLPQGGVEAPRVNAGAAIGEAIAQAGNALGGAVQDIARADQIQQQKNDSAWLGNAKPQAELDLNNQIQALNDPTSKTYVDPTSDEYRASVDKLITDYANEATKTAPSDVSKAALSNYITSLRVGYGNAAYQYSDEKKTQKRVADVNASNQKWGALIVSSGGARYQEAVTQQEALIRQQFSDPVVADEKVGKMKAFMAGYAMNAEAGSNPQQFLAGMGAWAEKGADPSDIAQAQAIAESEIRRQQNEAKAEATRRQAQYQANVGARLDDAISSVQVNGGIMPVVAGKPLITEKEIRAAHPDDPIRAQREVDKLNTALTIGQATALVKDATKEDVERLIKSTTPEKGQVFTDNDAALQSAVMAAAKAKFDALSDEIKADINDSQNEAQSTFLKNFDDYVQTAGSTGSIPEDAYVSLAEAGFSPEKTQEYRQKLNEAVQYGGIQKQIQEGSAIENNAIYDNLVADAKAGGPGSAAAAQKADAIRTALVAKQNAYAGDDPAGAAVTYSTGVAQAWADVDKATDPDARQAAIRNAIRLGTIEQQRQNVAPQKIKPLPEANANAIIGQFKSLPTPGAKFDFLMQMVDLGGETGQSVLAQLSSIKGGLLPGTDLIIDKGRTDPVKGAELFSALYADTGDKQFPEEGKKAVLTEAQQGLVGVISTQAEITGNWEAAGAMQDDIINATQQIAKARYKFGTDATEAARAAYTDLTGQYALINDRRFAVVHYPKAIESAAPGAVEAGLAAARDNVVKQFQAEGNFQTDAYGRSIASGAVWVNNGNGFALVMPGSDQPLPAPDTPNNRGLFNLKTGEPIFLTYEQARDLGVKAIAEGNRSGYVNPGKPATAQGPDQPYFMTNDIGDARARELPSAAGMKALNLTPQEQFLYKWHVNNLVSGKGVKNADGSTSTILQRVVEHDGKFYNVPSVWDGKIHNSEREAKQHAAQIGWDKWPSYATPEEADRRYLNDMHPLMEQDVP